MDSIEHLKFREEVKHYMRVLREASSTIIDQGVSSHPIFVFHRNEIAIGIELANPDKDGGEWFVQASTLEEFVTKQIIDPNKVKTFQEAFKNPETHLCLFVVDGASAEFIFIPKVLPDEN